MTLLEVLLAAAIGITLTAALAQAMTAALNAQTSNRDSNDRVGDARLAMDRIEAAVRLTPSSAALSTKASDATSEGWLAASTLRSGGVTFCVRGIQLVEKSPSANDCAVAAGDRVLATGVTAFSFTRVSNGTFTTVPVLDVGLTLGSGTESVSVTSRIRLGGGGS